MARRISASVAWPDRNERQPGVGASPTEQAERIFRPVDAGLGENRRMQRRQAVLDLQRMRPVALERRLHQLGAGSGRDIRGHRNTAMPAGGHRRERRHVFAGKLDKVRTHRVSLARHAAHVAGRVLDADDVGKLGKPLHGVDGHVDHAARGDIVDDDRDADCVVDGLEMLVEAFLRRLVVIGRDDENGVRPAVLGMAAKLDRLRGVVGARARDHRNPAARFVDADVHGAAVLLMGERRAFAGRPDRHQPMRAGRDLPVDQRAEGLLVDLAVLERGHQRRHRSVKLRPLFHLPRPACPRANRFAPGPLSDT